MRGGAPLIAAQRKGSPNIIYTAAAQDWMAMNGINLPLAFVGQEWLWVEVFKEYGETHRPTLQLQCLLKAVHMVCT